MFLSCFLSMYYTFVFSSSSDRVLHDILTHCHQLEKVLALFLLPSLSDSVVNSIIKPYPTQTLYLSEALKKLVWLIFSLKFFLIPAFRPTSSLPSLTIPVTPSKLWKQFFSIPSNLCGSSFFIPQVSVPYLTVDTITHSDDSLLLHSWHHISSPSHHMSSSSHPLPLTQRMKLSYHIWNGCKKKTSIRVDQKLNEKEGTWAGSEEVSGRKPPHKWLDEICNACNMNMLQLLIESFTCLNREKWIEI